MRGGLGGVRPAGPAHAGCDAEHCVCGDDFCGTEFRCRKNHADKGGNKIGPLREDCASGFLRACSFHLCRIFDFDFHRRCRVHPLWCGFHQMHGSFLHPLRRVHVFCPGSSGTWNFTGSNGHNLRGLRSPSAGFPFCGDPPHPKLLCGFNRISRGLGFHFHRHDMLL